jgi:prophage tail gpP-like protein
MSRIIVKNAATGKELVWRHLKINKSLDNICHTLEAELAPSERLLVHKHNSIEVRYQSPGINDKSAENGGRLVTTVLVDEVTAEAESGRHSVSVIGRSPARDIIDSAWKDSFSNDGNMSGMKLLEVASAVAGRFGINCYTIPKGISTGIVTAFRFENESPWEKLVGEADKQGFILTSNQAGDLYLWQVAGAVFWSQYELTEGKNVKTVRWTENGAEQFHEYVITGGGRTVNAIDNTVPGARILTINMTDPEITFDKIKRRAETEMRRRKENKTIVTVSGWGLTDSQIKRLGDTAGKEIFWEPNILIPVKIPSLGLDRILLISEVEYEASPQAMTSMITLVNKEAYL